MLLSLHLTKTAGTSFGLALQKHFGATFQEDYADLPINTPPLRRKTRALRHNLAVAARRHCAEGCIHGHFLPAKYLLLRWRTGARLVTWLRDPVERLASHFHYWKRSYHAGAAPLHRRMVEEGWSFERFSLGRELRNIYTQFLWGVSLWQFAFVGITEYFAEDFAQFSALVFGEALTPVKANVNAETKQVYVHDPSLRARIEAHHRKDMHIYAQALVRRAARRPVTSTGSGCRTCVNS